MKVLGPSAAVMGNLYTSVTAVKPYCAERGHVLWGVLADQAAVRCLGRPIALLLLNGIASVTNQRLAQRAEALAEVLLQTAFESCQPATAKADPHPPQKPLQRTCAVYLSGIVLS